jgi:AcrR family transcriptional regulator
MSRAASRSKPGAGPGRRERKKAQTRQALSRQAVELFMRRGFDNVTVAEITEHVDVDPSTFFRHFGSKEAVLCADRERALDLIAEMVQARPSREPLRKAVVEAFVQLHARLPHESTMDGVRQRLAQNSDAIAALIEALSGRLRTALSRAIAARLRVDPGSDPRPEVFAGAFVAALGWSQRRALRDGSLDLDAVLSGLEDALTRTAPLFRKSLEP